MYRQAVLDEVNSLLPLQDPDPYRLALLKHYRSLMPMAMEARKPIFYLKPADGAIGSHAQATKSCYRDFLALAKKVANGAGVSMK